MNRFLHSAAQSLGLELVGLPLWLLLLNAAAILFALIAIALVGTGFW
jgi:hypothetical protein